MPERHVPLPDEVAKLFARAKAAEANPPRKHHLVPSSYLRSWERDGKLRVTDLERGGSWLTPAKKALRDTDFYELSGDGLDTDAVPPWLMETMLGRLEDEAVPALARLVAKPESLSSEDRFFVSNLLAFQYTRSRGFREEMKFLANEVFKATYGALTADGVRAERTRRGVDPTPERVDGSLRFFEDVQRGRHGSNRKRPSSSTRRRHTPSNSPSTCSPGCGSSTPSRRCWSPPTSQWSPSTGRAAQGSTGLASTRRESSSSR